MNMNERTNRTSIHSGRTKFSRRRFLHGVGACVALPVLPSLLERSARGGPAIGHATGQLAASEGGAPVRMAFVTFPNGVNQPNWWPTGDGKTWELSKTLAPLAKVKGKIQVFGGLDHINATAGSDGAGDHARASASLLTGARARKTSGADIHLGTSVDQLAAKHVGHLTRFRSLELTCDGVRNSGNCDSGYSCAYQFNVSWRSPTTPVPPEPNPRMVFERLFGGGTAEERRQNFRLRQQQQRSILDFVREETARFAGGLSRQDERKLDEYLTSVREIERRIEQSERFGEVPNPDYDTPEGVPDDFAERVQLMFDMLVLAFQTDSTRVGTLILAHDGNNRAFPEIGVAEGHHHLSHHQGNKEWVEKIGKIDHYYITQLGRFLEKLDSTADIDGRSLLDNSMIAYGCGISDGNAHSHTNLPVLLAGGGGGKFETGRFAKLPSMPMSNLYVDMLRHMGIEGIDHFGDSNGRKVLS